MLIYPPHQQIGKYFRIAVIVLAVIVVSMILINPEVKPLPALFGLVLLGGLGIYIGHIIDQQGLSFSLTDMHIQHHTPKGGWSIKWRNISQIGIPSVSTDGWHQPLPWFALKLKDYETFLDSVSYRLAGHIVMEQRALLLTAYRRAESPGQENFEDMMFDDTPYVGKSGKVYKGLMAMLANRMRYNRELLGFDVFVNEDLLDRPLDEFVGLCRRYLASAASEPANAKSDY